MPSSPSTQKSPFLTILRRLTLGLIFPTQKNSILDFELLGEREKIGFTVCGEDNPSSFIFCLLETQKKKRSQSSPKVPKSKI